MNIAQEVEQALIEVGKDLEGAPFMVSFLRATGDTPWGANAPEPFGPIVGFDKGNKKVRPRGSTEEVFMRVLLLSATTGYTPEMDDSTTLDGREFKIKSIDALAPVGETYAYSIGLVD